MKHVKRGRELILGLALGLVVVGMISGSQAALISGWTSDLNGTLVEEGPGVFSFTSPPGNTAARASFADISLAVGDKIRLSLLAFNGVNPVNQWGNIQFRYGLFDNRGQSGIAGWWGYWVGNSASGNSAGVYERGSSGNYYSTSGATQIYGTVATGSSGTATYTPPGTYEVSLTLTRTSATDLQIDWSMVQVLDAGGNPVSGVYSHTGTTVDTTVNTFTYNRVGFLVSGGAFTGTIRLSQIDVSYLPIPEPGSAMVLVLGSLLVAGLRRRS